MSRPLPANDPCQFMLDGDFISTPTIYSEGCYICNDPEFAQMGLPLCRICKFCKGHIAADNSICDDCGNEDIDES